MIPLRKKKILCSVTSGLGNQLFQYAAALHWKKTHGGEISIDKSWYHVQRHTPRREYRLELLNVTESQVPLPLGSALMVFRALSKRYPVPAASLLRRALGISAITEAETYRRDRRFESPDARGDICWLNGYWQTADHFESVREELLARIRPNFTVSGGYSEYLERVGTSGSVFVHIRRGDYAKFGNRVLSPDYYRKASGHFPEGTEWFVFSEDSDWARENIRLPGKSHHVEYSSQNRDVEDLLLMASCAGGILANSSYSWWAAALGNRPRKRIVSPMYWWGDRKSRYPDLHLKDWIAVDNLAED